MILSVRRQGKSLWGWALIKAIAADNGGVPSKAIAVGNALWLPTGEVITYPLVDSEK